MVNISFEEGDSVSKLRIGADEVGREVVGKNVGIIIVGASDEYVGKLEGSWVGFAEFIGFLDGYCDGKKVKMTD